MIKPHNVTWNLFGKNKFIDTSIKEKNENAVIESLIYNTIFYQCKYRNKEQA